ncbi:hypothetical protein [Phocaeicola coprocola]|uniref:hypothetical protein n=1 Tax=Phocaeicola coprocola TaxID=310298 RepID=UPI0032C166EB
MKNISKNAIIGYPAGIITGITYGLNPLFGVPLMKEGAAIESILFFRYAIAVLFLGGFLLLSRQSQDFMETSRRVTYTRTTLHIK